MSDSAADAPLSPRYFIVNGVKLEYDWQGPGPEQVPTLVLLHEGLGCVAHWKDFPAQLAEATGCGVLVYSRAGYGRSDPVTLPRPLDYMQQEALQVLPALLAQAALRDVVLIGHSDGGSIALIYGGGVPNTRLRGIVTLAAHVLNEAVCIASIQAARTAFEQGDLREGLARYHGANVDCAFWGWNRAWLDPGFVNWTIESYLPTIQVPLLAIQGEDDEYGSIRQLDAIREQTGGPVETVLLPACRHSPQRDQTQVTLQALQRFIASL